MYNRKSFAKLLIARFLDKNSEGSKGHGRLAGKLGRIALVFVFSGIALATAYDWPQWRGPDCTDVSPESDLLDSWPNGGPQRVWMFREAGVGYSGPAIVGDRLFLMGGRDGTEQLFALDVESGKELGSADIGEVLSNNWGDGPRGTPTVDGRLERKGPI